MLIERLENQTDGLAAEILKIGERFHVNYYDTDANEQIPGTTICKDFEPAKNKALEFTGQKKPAGVNWAPVW